MKRTTNSIAIFCALFLGINAFTFGQNKEGKSEDLGRIALNAYVSDQVEGLPSSAERMLQNKLNQIATYNGIGGSMLNPRFIITPNIVVLTKDLTATAPPKTALTLEITFYIGDGIEGNVFATESMEYKGVGDNETKAYIAAIKQIKPGHPSLKSFVEKAKVKIVDYYNTQCDFILKKVDGLEAQNNYEEALFVLSNVPQVSKECYEKSTNKIGPIYKKYIDRDCKMKLQEAQGVWSASQSMEAANEAGKLLSSVDPAASCFGDIKKLNKEIATRVLEVDKREWEYTLTEQLIVREQVQAAKDIGVAFGNGQPQTVTYNTTGWF